MALHNESLKSIKEGMKVFDSEGVELGDVASFYFPEGDAAFAAEPSNFPERHDNFVTYFARAFRDDKVPDELQERLAMHGFIRIDSSTIFTADRYVMLENIASVEEGEVHLNLKKEQVHGRKI